MTTETEFRVLLEQAREALDLSRRFVYQDSRPQVDAAFDALNAELAKPAERADPVAFMWEHEETGRTGFIEANIAKDWTKLNPRQPLVMPVYSHTPTPTWHDAPKVAAIKAERDAAMKDAERYRWLTTHARTTSEHWGGRWSIVIDGPAPERHGCKDALDEAIDAAIAKAEGRKE